jgi:hypothetical protein
MHFWQNTPRMVISVVVASAVVAAYSVGSFAARAASVDAGENKPAPALQQEPTQQEPPAQTGGHLISAGLVTINGHPAKNGTTVVSGATVATGSDGNAVIDFGGMGRVNVRANTSFILTITPTGFVVTPICDRIHVAVGAGAVDLKTTPPQTLQLGGEGDVGRGIEIGGGPNCEFTVDCSLESPRGGGYTGPGPVGVASLIAVAGGTAAGIISGGGKPPTRSALSPFIP